MTRERDLKSGSEGSEGSAELLVVYDLRDPLAWRAAYDSVYSVYSSVSSTKDLQHAEEELGRLLERAERTQDPELADAVYHVATEKGVRGVADAYPDARPKERKRWEKYVDARQEAESLDRKLGHAMGFGLMKPPELNSRHAPSCMGLVRMYYIFRGSPTL
jgi:hypothetical protein